MFANRSHRAEFEYENPMVQRLSVREIWLLKQKNFFCCRKPFLWFQPNTKLSEVGQRYLIPKIYVWYGTWKLSLVVPLSATVKELWALKFAIFHFDSQSVRENTLVCMSAIYLKTVICRITLVPDLESGVPIPYGFWKFKALAQVIR